MRSYLALLARLHGFHAPLEARLAAMPETRQLGIDMAARAKARLATHDLMPLGWPQNAIDSIPRCMRLPALRKPAEIWGCLYVVEGSTLGGQVITRMVKDRLHLTQENGCAFFAGYGQQTAAMWREFCGSLNTFAEDHPAVQEEIVGAAIETFVRFEEWVTC
jgi:heme oxygenase